MKSVIIFSILLLSSATQSILAEKKTTHASSKTTHPRIEAHKEAAEKFLKEEEQVRIDCTNALKNIASRTTLSDNDKNFLQLLADNMEDSITHMQNRIRTHSTSLEEKNIQKCEELDKTEMRWNKRLEEDRRVNEAAKKIIKTTTKKTTRRK